MSRAELEAARSKGAEAAEKAAGESYEQCVSARARERVEGGKR